MLIDTVLRSLPHAVLGLLIWLQGGYAAATPAEIAPPGSYHTSWVGNSFGGNGAGPHEGLGSPARGFGYWVQDNITAMAVSQDGTVFIGSIWDEGGRGVGLYKDGMVNRVLVTAMASPIGVFDFSTANQAICVDESSFYLGNQKSGLLRFQWSPGDINSAKYLETVVLPEAPVSLSCRDGKILVGYPDRLELRDEITMQLAATYYVSGLSSALLAPDGSFWVVERNAVRHLRPDGSDTGTTVPGINIPASLAWGKDGSLIVTDNGPAQQVLFVNVAGEPKLISRFGAAGGLYSGTPGAVAPQKLFALRGAGMDKDGNLYVGMSFSSQPNGNTFIRAFSPSGSLAWEEYSAAFVDPFGFEPGSDGTVIYGRTARWKMDYSRQTPGTEATLDAITLDPLRYPNDPRLKRNGYSVTPRLIDGTQLLYCVHQHGGGFDIFASSADTDIVHYVGSTPNRGFAWYVTDNGDIWEGDAPGKTIALYRLKSMSDGKPIYDWTRPQAWPWPADFQSVTRVVYQQKTDTLYIFGYGPGQKDNGAWGTLGWTGRRYDHWLSGHPTVKWTNQALPGSGMIGAGETVPPGDVSVAGDYLFLGTVRDSKIRFLAKVNIMSASTGQYVGTLKAGPEVGKLGGWEDIPSPIHAMQRKDGEYLILVEDDDRAKNILFRWNP